MLTTCSAWLECVGRSKRTSAFPIWHYTHLHDPYDSESPSSLLSLLSAMIQSRSQPAAFSRRLTRNLCTSSNFRSDSVIFLPSPGATFLMTISLLSSLSSLALPLSFFSDRWTSESALARSEVECDFFFFFLFISRVRERAWPSKTYFSPVPLNFSDPPGT